MTHKENWLEKEFDFDFPVSRFGEFIEALRETPSKVEMLVHGLSEEVLTRRDGDSWSIQENVGHFLTVESLFLGRLDDYENDAAVLRPARFEDNPTDKAEFNKVALPSILAEFRSQREGYVRRLDALDPEAFGKAITHPRLNVPMRLCDMLAFHVAHDQHHLARIEELQALWHLNS